MPREDGELGAAEGPVSPEWLQSVLDEGSDDDLVRRSVEDRIREELD